jgi:hypothetical protein
MRTSLRWVPAGFALLLCGCSEPPPPPPAPPAVKPVLELKQLMEWVVDPAADVIWDSVKTIYTSEGVKEIRPQTDEQWDNVRNGAATLVEAGTMLMIEARARDNKEWMAAARRLSGTAGKALKAAQGKDLDALFEAGEAIYHACSACHQRYAAFAQDNAPGKESPDKGAPARAAPDKPAAEKAAPAASAPAKPAK